MIVTTIKIHCLPQKRREIIQTIRGLNAQALKDAGCNNASFYQDMHNEDIFYLMEEWQSQSALENYKNSRSYSVLFGLEGLLVESLEIKHGVKCRSDARELGGGECE